MKTVHIIKNSDNDWSLLLMSYGKTVTYDTLESAEQCIRYLVKEHPGQDFTIEFTQS